MGQGTAWGVISNIILFLTFLALLWYSWETRQMRKEMVEQTKLQLAPCLTMDFVPRDLSPLLVVNCGEATARNIEVECSPFPEHVDFFERISTINKGQEKYIRKKNKGANRISESIMGDFRTETTFRLKYKNIFGKRYESKVVLKDTRLFFLNEFKVIS